MKKIQKSFKLTEKTQERLIYLSEHLECSETHIVELAIRQIYNDLDSYCIKNNTTLEKISYLPLFNEK